MPDSLSRRDLLNYGSQIRGKHSILHNCWYVNRDFRDSIWSWVEQSTLPGYPEDYAGVVRVTVTDPGQDAKHGKHYVVIIDSSIVTDDLADGGIVIVDAALDQFNDWQYSRGAVPFSLGSQQSLAPVVIAPPADSFRQSVYHDQFDINPDADISPELPV